MKNKIIKEVWQKDLLKARRRKKEGKSKQGLRCKPFKHWVSRGNSSN